MTVSESLLNYFKTDSTVYVGRADQVSIEADVSNICPGIDSSRLLRQLFYLQFIKPTRTYDPSRSHIMTKVAISTKTGFESDLLPRQISYLLSSSLQLSNPAYFETNTSLIQVWKCVWRERDSLQGEARNWPIAKSISSSSVYLACCVSSDFVSIKYLAFFLGGNKYFKKRDI